MSGDLTDKRIAVVGGSSGVGLAIGVRAVARGANVTLLGRDEDRLRSAAAIAGGADIRRLDLTIPETITAAISSIGQLDHLVVTAGTFRPSPLGTAGPEDWRRILEERLVGPLTLVKGLAPRISSSIVLCSGTLARRPAAGCVLYAAACAGVESAARALALELAPLRVNVVAPGVLDTPMLEMALASDKSRVCTELAARLPVRRVGTAEDAADAALFLIANSYMSGATIEIDGGARLI